MLVAILALSVSTIAAAETPKCRKGMIYIPAGTFTMGSEEKKDVHQVTLSGFCIDRTEVTRGAYATCVKQRKCKAPSYTPPLTTMKHPISYVDWDHANTYCAAQGLRLPTDEEWEYAARGTDGRIYPWGDYQADSFACWDSRVLDGAHQYSIWRNYGTDFFPESCKVGSFSKDVSPFGVMDMAGNVEEWTSTSYQPGTYAVRGGSKHEHNDLLRVDLSFQKSVVPTLHYQNIGFRCASAPVQNQ